MGSWISRRRTLVRWSVVATLGLGISGCYEGHQGTPGADLPGESAGDAESGDDDGGYDEVPAGQCGEPSMRRLSHFEYRNSLRDLFPAIEVPMPNLAPDPAPHGLDNHAPSLTVSELLTGQYFDSARVVATAAVEQLDTIVQCEGDDAACAHKLVATLGRRVYRRPLFEDEIVAIEGLFGGEAEGDFELGAALAIEAMLQSPQFLYRMQPSEAEPEQVPYRVASRLSYFLWGSTPDEALLEAAEADALRSPEEIAIQVERMLEDPRAAASFAHFFHQWIDGDRVRSATKLPEEEFDRESAVEESRRFVQDILLANDGTVADLFTSRRAVIDATMADIYGVDHPGEGWIETELPEHRPGLLTRIAFLAGFAVADRPSPVPRGIHLVERVMCGHLPDPPPNVEIPEPDEGGDPKTNREVLEAMTAAPNCQGCHAIINPAGFAFEHYDQVGRYRQTDAGKPVDASGQLPTGEAYSDATELMQLLAQSPKVHQCMVDTWLSYAYGTALEQLGECGQDRVAEALTSHDDRLSALLMAIATQPEFYGVTAEQGQ